MKPFDLIVVGAGSGLEVSAAAARRGWKVAVVDAGPFGGTCLNRGCIPSKELVQVADVARTIREAEGFGVHGRLAWIDWPFIVQRTFERIDAEASQIEEANRPSENVGSPRTGSVGLTEQAAEERGMGSVSATYAYDQTAYGSSIEDHDGVVKVLPDAGSGQNLGCHVIGHDASVARP